MQVLNQFKHELKCARRGLSKLGREHLEHIQNQHIIYPSPPFAKLTKVICLRDKLLRKMKLKLRPCVSHASKVA